MAVTERLQLTELEGLQISEEYAANLRGGLACFYNFSRLAGLDESRFVEAPYLNVCAARFVNYVFQHQGSRNECKHGLLALQRQYTHSLPRGWKALAGWNELKGRQSRVPLPFDILQAMVLTALGMALQSFLSPSLLWTSAVLIQVGFCGLLRPKEIVNLRRCDVIFSDDTGLFSQNSEVSKAVLRIRTPKNRAHWGFQQFVVIETPSVVAWQQWLVSGLLPNQKLWPSSQDRFRKVFSVVIERLGLTRIAFKPSSLRAGGATFLFLSNYEVARINCSGRWASETFVNVYIFRLLLQSWHCAVFHVKKSFALHACWLQEENWQGRLYSHGEASFPEASRLGAGTCLAASGIWPPCVSVCSRSRWNDH